MNAKNFRAIPCVSVVTGLAALLLLTGCAGAPYWGGWSKRPTAMQFSDGRGQSEPPAMPAQPSRPLAYVPSGQ